MSVKLQLQITDEAWTVIERGATERKRGEWLSRLIVQYASLLESAPSNDEQCGVLERIDTRLARLEKQFAMMLSNPAGGIVRSGDQP